MQRFFGLTSRMNDWPAISRLGSFVLIGLLLLGPATTATVKAGKPKPPPPPPTTNVKYELVWLPNIWGVDCSIRAYDLNDSGTVIGYASWEENNVSNTSAFAYIEGLMLDLNDLGASWSVLNDPAVPASGWIAISASGINNLGQIVGTAKHPNYASRAFVLDFPSGGTPHFTLLPSLGTGDIRGAAINDLSVVVGYSSYETGSETIVYTPWSSYSALPLGFNCDGRADINNSGAIVTRKGYFTAPDTVYNYIPGNFDAVNRHWFYSINESGQIAGSRESIRGRNGQAGGPLRRTNSTDKLLAVGNITDFAGGINDVGDVCLTNAGRGFVYTDQLGTLALDNLVVSDDPNALSFWNNQPTYPWAINSRDSTGFGQICGQSSGPGFYRSFLLTPVLPPAP